MQRYHPFKLHRAHSPYPSFRPLQAILHKRVVDPRIELTLLADAAAPKRASCALTRSKDILQWLHMRARDPGDKTLSQQCSHATFHKVGFF